MKNQIAEIQVSYKSKIAKKDRVKISQSNDAYKTLLGLWNMNLIELQEQFWLLLLNRANEIIGAHCLSTGGATSTIMEVKFIFAIAIKCNACAIIIAHNHPSGNLKPSNNDVEITKKIKSASQFLGIELLDHIIVTTEGYYSFVDERGLS
jgi:DNA repair protein RadC